MKKTDLEKNKGKQIVSTMYNAAIPDRYGQGSANVVDRRERRKQDQALGLVPFACKLDGKIVARLHALAAERKIAMSDLVAELLNKGLAQP